HGRYAAVEQAPRGRAADARDASGIVAIGAVPDDAMRARLRGVQHRQAVDGDSDFTEIMGDQPRAKPGETFRPLDARSRALESGGGRIAAPMRRSQALHAPALLIDQDRRSGVAERLADRAGERAKLRPRFDVPPEQNHAPGPRLTQKGALFVRQR